MASVKETSAGSSDPVTPPQWLMDAALARIHAGRLPREPQPRVIAGPGRGQSCALCEHSIATGDVGYEVAGEEEVDGDARRLPFHLCCYRAWVKACSLVPRSLVRRLAAADAGRPPDANRSGA